ncbi:MAG: GNAT family acetyltransferase [Desulforhopalus sp.]
MIIRSYQTTDQEAVLRLWRDCGLTQPQNNPLTDIQRKLSVQPELFLVGLLGENLIATVMAGYDGHRGWLNYLAVSPEHRQHGFGSKIVMAAEKELQNLGCPKINIQIRLSNKEAMEFYRKIGFHIDEVASMGKRIIED